MRRKIMSIMAVFISMAFILSGCGKTDTKSTMDTGTEAVAKTSKSRKKVKVYFTKDISAKGLVKIYKKLGFKPSGKTAVKISTGEPPASNYLRPELIKDLVQNVNGTIVECNTAYGGARSSTAMHKQVAEDHGFTAIADVEGMAVGRNEHGKRGGIYDNRPCDQDHKSGCSENMHGMEKIFSLYYICDDVFICRRNDRKPADVKMQKLIHKNMF